ncbi:MAG: sel1 repeat family protein [Kordiimonadaceae bacterium]|jgi:uncharacterized protein|nr:sel1 repeat family protein [Kordiimonadaceae bacterium]
MNIFFKIFIIYFCSYQLLFADLVKGLEAVQSGDFETAAKEFVIEAEKGNSEAQYLLHSMFLDGFGVNKDTNKAISYLKQSAENNHVEAQFIFGTHLLSGRYIEKNEKEAFKWNLKAANNGHLKAAASAGIQYMQGIGVDVNPKEGFEWHLKAAIQGLKESQYMLGAIYQFGIGTEIDYFESLKWIKSAAQNNHQQAIQRLQSLGISIKIDDDVIGREYLEKAEVAIYIKEYDIAVEELQKAADLNNINAQYQLGFMNLTGQGIKVNFLEAKKWFLLAANNGDAQAQFNLGMMYVNGDGVPQDIVEATKWFLITKSTDETKEQGIIKSLAPGMSTEQTTEAEKLAENWLLERKQ